MYAVVNKRLWPPGLEEVEYLSKMLKQVSWDYEVRLEKLMFAGMEGYPLTKFAIVRWARGDYNVGATYTLLWEGTDMDALTGMLRLLIATEKSEAEARQIARP